VLGEMIATHNIERERQHQVWDFLARDLVLNLAFGLDSVCGMRGILNAARKAALRRCVASEGDSRL
jgi:hypothetical protein